MKKVKTTIALLSLVPVGVMPLLGQGFDSGSNGSYGPLLVTENLTLDMPPDGIFHCTTITVNAGATLQFNPNALNTPVYLLATGDITVQGQISVNGVNGTSLAGGRGGPGGFRGGAPGLDSLPPGAGHGPGGGKGAASTAVAAGRGAYGVPYNNPSINDGEVYGSPLLFPVAGGSGEGGRVTSGGGGGGGAVLLASNTRIMVTGTINARPAGGGSGGGIRLVAPRVEGNGQIHVNQHAGVVVGAGRVRIDTIEKDGMALNVQPSVSRTVGSFMRVFPDPEPRLDIIEAAGTAVPEGSGPVRIELPFGSSTERTVTVQARGFGAPVPVRVVLTPESGDPIGYDALIDNATANPALAVLDVTVPENTVVHVHAWTLE